MHLTPEQEAQLLEDNKKKIYRAVDNFTARGSKSPVSIDTEDFVSEVTIVFLKHIRSCETMEQINRFPWHDAMHAMSELVLSFQPISVPKDTERFSSLIRSMPSTVSYEVMAVNGLDVDGMARHWVEDKELQMDFDDFMSTQDGAMRRLAAMKISGMNQRIVASQFGVSEPAISKKIHKLKQNYDKYFEEDENDG